jgi:hypothetical protein
MRDKRIAKEDRVLTAKILVNKVLLGFLNDWESYSTADQFYSNEDAQHIAFIDDKRLEYHVDQFVLIATKIGSLGLLPDKVPTKLLEFAARMRPIIKQSDIVSADAWSREYPDCLPNQLDALLIDIIDMSKNIDEYCDTT